MNTSLDILQDIADLNEAVAQLDASVKEASENRSKEKAANTATLADANPADVWNFGMSELEVHKKCRDCDIASLEHIHSSP